MEEIRIFMTWLIEERGEKVAARRLLKYSLGGHERWKRDTCNMIYHNIDKIDDAVKRKYLSKGCTMQLHDDLIYVINHFEYNRRKIRYYSYERDWECEINGYVFELPEYTDELADAGRCMHNCVATYIKQVYYKKCTIILVKNDAKYIACIEINLRDNCPEIVQALGIGNNKIEGDALHVITFWLRGMMMFDAMFDLTDDGFDNIPLTDYIYHRLPGKQIPYFLYTKEKLLALPKEERGQGFYRALATKVVSKLTTSFVGWMFLSMELEEFDDEIDFVNSYSPCLECVAKDAQDGNGEAQLILSKLHNHCIHGGALKAGYWKNKAHSNNEYHILSLKRYNSLYDE